jgi:NAD(P)-dependent dehydrogenase (short-subunit alcohol dehydrogenase family)
LQTNLFGVINGLNTFIPHLKSQTTPSTVIITGSKQGITNPPGNPAYNASKAAVKSLAEQLSYDMRDTPTTVHLLVPGWTFTGITGGGSAAKKPDGAWAPEQVAEFMIKKVEEGQFYIICPDNEVTQDVDKQRVIWTAGDIAHGRQPLSRWRNEYKEEAAKWMEENKF